MDTRHFTISGSTLNRRLTAAMAAAILAIGAIGLQAAPLFTLQLQSTPKTSAENTGVSALIGFNILDTATGLVVDLTLTNTTAPAIGSSLTAVGLEWPDIFSSVPALEEYGASSYFYRLDYNDGVSPDWLTAPGGYDIMITSDGNFEGGSSKGAPRAGQSQSVRLALGSTPLSLQQVENEFISFYTGGADYLAVARFQAVGPSADRSDKVIVPEPSTVSFLALAMLGLARRNP